MLKILNKLYPFLFIAGLVALYVYKRGQVADESSHVIGTIPKIEQRLPGQVLNNLGLNKKVVSSPLQWKELEQNWSGDLKGVPEPPESTRELPSFRSLNGSLKNGMLEYQAGLALTDSGSRLKLSWLTEKAQLVSIDWPLNNEAVQVLQSNPDIFLLKTQGHWLFLQWSKDHVAAKIHFPQNNSSMLGLFTWP